MASPSWLSSVKSGAAWPGSIMAESYSAALTESATDGDKVPLRPYASRMRIWGAAAAVGLTVVSLSGCSQSEFCDSIGSGRTPSSAAHAYLSKCGANYTIARRLYDDDKQSSGFASYNGLVEYALRVHDNSEASLAFLLVGQRTRRGIWRTLGRPGTGP